jgi:hypothetical protein
MSIGEGDEEKARRRAFPRPGDGIDEGCNPKRNLFPAGRKEVTVTLAETVIILLMLVQIFIDLYLKKAS